jgi:PcfJ-like protein
MARSSIQYRQEAERQRIAYYEASLRLVSATRRPAPDFETAIAEAKKGFENLIVRDAWDWAPRLKTRDAARLRLAAARYLFARYPVPAHLERIWRESDGLSAREVKLRKRWYVAAARGDSLYKASAFNWLSRKEVHVFLNAPGDLTFDEAFWYAVAKSYTQDQGVALRIARSGIAMARRSAMAFWREAARFFAVNPTTREEIDDISDFLAAQLQRDVGYSLKGRTLASLRRQMRDWHRDLLDVARIEALQRRAQQGNGRASAVPDRWAGAEIENWSWQPNGKDARRRGEAFVVVQLVTAEALVIESRVMRHCVLAYARKCVCGMASIWSLRRVVKGDTDRLLTIELDRQHRAVQVRGFANRVATGEELQLLARWSKARGIALLQ